MKFLVDVHKDILLMKTIIGLEIFRSHLNERTNDFLKRKSIKIGFENKLRLRFE